MSFTVCFLVWVFIGALYSNSSYPPPKAFTGTVALEVRGGFHFDETSAFPAFPASLACSVPRSSLRLEASPWHRASHGALAAQGSSVTT